MSFRQREFCATGIEKGLLWITMEAQINMSAVEADENSMFLHHGARAPRRRRRRRVSRFISGFAKFEF